MSMNNPMPTLPPRKRLLLISQYFPVHIGGAEQQVYCLAKHLRATMDVHYLTLSNRPIESGEPDITIWTVPYRPRLRRILGRYYLLDYRRVWEALQRIDPDIIYTRYASVHMGIAARYALSSACTLIWHIASEAGVQPFWWESFRTMPFDYLNKRVVEYGIRHADYIFGQAQYEEDLLRRNYGRTCDLIVGNWHPEPTVPCTKRSPVKVVWVANIKSLKKPETFIELARRLRTVTEAEFLMIGRPGGAKYQRRLETQMKHVRGLTYLGKQSNEEINRILGESHLLVNTSDTEGFSNTFVQAWLHEVPVVSLHVDPDDVLTRQGLGFRSGSQDKLVQDTRRLIEDADLRTRIGKRARVYALEHHSLEKNLNRVAAFFEKVSRAGTKNARAWMAQP
ncbi:MAG: glycosyltransferase family 4 protein [Planctomycetes bacterium]|nr:glycosyltransferase family 4 protein [Planctomycetota bacterium]